MIGVIPPKCWRANSSSRVCLNPFPTGQDRNLSSGIINHRRSWNYRYFLRNGLEPSQSVSIPQGGTSAQSGRGSTGGIHPPGGRRSVAR